MMKRFSSNRIKFISITLNFILKNNLQVQENFKLIKIEKKIII